MRGMEVENRRLPRVLVLDVHSFSARVVLFTTRLTSLNSRNSPVSVSHTATEVWALEIQALLCQTFIWVLGSLT